MWKDWLLARYQEEWAKPNGPRSLSAFAEKLLGVPHRTFMAWMDGKSPSYSMAMRVAMRLGLPKDDVLAAAGIDDPVLAAAGHRDISYGAIVEPGGSQDPDTVSGSTIVKGGPGVLQIQPKRDNVIGARHGDSGGKRLSLTLDIERYLDLRPELRDQVERAAIEAAILAAAEAIKGG